MSVDRNAIFDPLLARLKATAPFVFASRRLKRWDEVADKPANFFRDTYEVHPPPTAHGLPSKVTLMGEIWIYDDAGKDPDIAPSASLNSLVKAVCDALEPDPLTEVQTLGVPNVETIRVDGRVLKDAGDVSKKARALIPILILVP